MIKDNGLNHYIIEDALYHLYTHRADLLDIRSKDFYAVFSIQTIPVCVLTYSRRFVRQRTFTDICYRYAFVIVTLLAVCVIRTDNIRSHDSTR